MSFDLAWALLLNENDPPISSVVPDLTRVSIWVSNQTSSVVRICMQNIVTPLTRLVAGNCHWNRDTEKTVKRAGFKIEQRRDISWFMMPFVVLRAAK